MALVTFCDFELLVCCKCFIFRSKADLDVFKFTLLAGFNELFGCFYAHANSKYPQVTVHLDSGEKLEGN